MSFFMFLYFSFLLFLFLPASSKQSLCHDSERFALLQFKESLSINISVSVSSGYPKTSFWNPEENSDCCSWDGVECNENTGYVIKLDLSSSYLYGPINSTSTLFNLVYLQWLSLADNHFTSSRIPSEIKNLSNLSHLNLSWSVFSGQIPSEILELSKLESLALDHNKDLEIQQPGLESLVQKLTNLRVLDLHSVDISSSLPHALTDLSALKFLSLANCELTGTILWSLGNLNNLTHLDLSDNWFQGQIPSEMLELSQLEYLDLSWNEDLQLQQPGGLRSLVDKLTNLKWLDLDWVNISSSLPNSLGNLSSLTYLSLDGCNLQGTIPSSIGSLTKLVHLDISSNNFWDELPISIGNLCSLQALDFSNNQWSIQTLSSLGNLTQLNTLTLSDNNFSSGNSSSLSWIAKQTKLTTLSLSSVNLAGEIPFWLLNLTHLSYLDMSSNRLTGPIPSWLMNLNHLSSLSFHSNQLTDQIPSEISNLTQLIILRLSSNRLQGPIPSSIFELKNLQYLNLYSNKLNGIVELDVYFLNFKSLEVLVLSSNNFSVLTKNTVNTTIQKFGAIGLGSCNLTEFPNFLQNQDELLGLDLSSNNIPGQIPGWFLNISKIHLVSLNLSYNVLTGFDHHPAVLPWTNLFTLDLRSNKLQGSLPLPASSTKFYLASNNKLSGEISPQICKLNNLHALDLSYNNLGGVLPQCLGNFSNYLTILGLQSNDFNGSIPHMSGSSLRMIDFSRNKLQGKIPKSFANCKSLEFLNLGYNQITETFPSRLGILPELKVLILTSNRFRGVISQPKTNCKFPKLQIIDLSNNLFMGELPSKYFRCWNSMKVVNGSQLTYMEDRLSPSSYLAYAYFNFPRYAYAFMMNNKGIELAYGKISNKLTSISLSGNKFTGDIPESISDLRGLTNLNFSNNNLLGHIPPSLGNLTVLESLDLSNNKLFGEIPDQLARLTSLEFINISHNHLTGPIPEGPQFNTFENISFLGNPGLCGKPLSKKCKEPEDLKKGEQGSSESRFAFDLKIVLMIGFVSGLVVGVILGNELFTNITEWFAMTFGRQLMKVKRR